MECFLLLVETPGTRTIKKRLSGQEGRSKKAGEILVQRISPRCTSARFR